VSGISGMSCAPCPERQGHGPADEEYGLGHARRAVAAQVTSDFAAAGGVAYEDRFVKVEGLDELGEVVSVGVHLKDVDTGLGREGAHRVLLGRRRAGISGWLGDTFARPAMSTNVARLRSDRMS
jgi:hypothetical protein